MNADAAEVAERVQNVKWKSADQKKKKTGPPAASGVKTKKSLDVGCRSWRQMVWSWEQVPPSSPTAASSRQSQEGRISWRSASLQVPVRLALL